MNTITVQNFEVVLPTASEEAINTRDDLLVRVETCPIVTDAASQEKATNLLRDLRNFSRTIEAGRKEAKDLVLPIGRKIDALAKELSYAVDQQADRIGGILGSYDIEQKRIAEEKREAAAREEYRIRREAEAKERAEEERQRKLAAQARAEVERQKRQIEAEAQAKADRARTEAGKERAAKEAEAAKARLAEQARLDEIAAQERAAREQKARDDEETRKVAETRQTAYMATADKPKDTVTSRKLCFEVDDVQALYKSNPTLVVLAPNTTALRAVLKNLGKDQTIPGVRHWFEAVTITRGVS